MEDKARPFISATSRVGSFILLSLLLCFSASLLRLSHAHATLNSELVCVGGAL